MAACTRFRYGKSYHVNSTCDIEDKFHVIIAKFNVLYQVNSISDVRDSL